MWLEVLADLETPVSAYAKLVGDSTGFLLESVEHGERWSRFSFVGREPSATLVLRDGRITVDGTLPPSVPLDQGILAALDALLHEYRSPSIPELPPNQGGVMGFLGYDVVREVERLPDVPRDDLHLPDAVVSVIGSLAAFDHWRQRVSLIESVPVLGRTGEALDLAYDEAVRRVEAMAVQLGQPLPYVAVEPPEPGEALPEVRSSMPAGQYEAAVEVAKEHILAGDIFQVVLSERFDLDLDADPFDVYRVLRQVNPSPYMYFLRHPEVTIVGSSPEPLVQLVDGKVISRPIAGTRRRGRTDEDDRRMAGELKENPKEMAEHVMLVDLARNDVGRVARFGTMHVDELMTLERYSHVMHLTSQVSGALVEGKGAIDVLRATLPAGTVSGAPKVQQNLLIYVGAIVILFLFGLMLTKAPIGRDMLDNQNRWIGGVVGVGRVPRPRVPDPGRVPGAGLRGREHVPHDDRRRGRVAVPRLRAAVRGGLVPAARRADRRRGPGPEGR